MSTEIWDLYDKNRLPTGKTVLRSAEIEKGLYRIVIHAVIIDSSGRMLIQQRQPFKHGWGGMWDLSVGGHVKSGETSSEGASRELAEEIGFRISPDELRPSLTVNFENGFDDIYIISADVDPQKLPLQEEEVRAVRLADKGEIFSMIDRGEFIPYRKDLISLIFEMTGGMGVHSK